MKVRTLAAALICFAPFSVAADSFGGLGRDAPGFTPVAPGAELTFPRDYGAHPGFRTEWWYLTANLRDGSGVSYGAQWTLFRQALKPGPEGEGWDSRVVFMGHAAVTSAAEHLFAETLARGGIGQAGVSPAPFEAFIDDWSMKAQGNGIAHVSVSASGSEFSYNFELTCDKGPVLQGDKGYSLKSDTGQASYYFSEPFYAVKGEILLHGKSVAVTGRAWMDREWSSQPLASDQTGWDWFSLHLPEGEKLMLFRLRSLSGRNFLGGTWIGADGAPQRLQAADITIEPLNETKLPSATLPTEWRVVVKSRGLNIVTKPLNPASWMGTRFSYWEGPIAFAGSHEGEGYLEMTGY